MKIFSLCKIKCQAIIWMKISAILRGTLANLGSFIVCQSPWHWFWKSTAMTTNDLRLHYKARNLLMAEFRFPSVKTAGTNRERGLFKSSWLCVKDRDIDFGSQRPTSSLLGKKFVDEKVLFSSKKTTSTNQRRGLFKIGVFSR